MPHFIDVVVKIVPEGLADATPSGRIVMGGSTSMFRLDQFVNGKICITPQPLKNTGHVEQTWSSYLYPNGPMVLTFPSRVVLLQYA